MSEQKNLLIVLGEWMEQRRSARQSAERSRGGRWHSVLRWLMPNGGTLLLVLILALTANVWAEPLLGTANVPGPSATTVNYQGRLADDAGTPLDGSYGMSFALYDAPNGGNLVWGPESHAAVSVSDGLFSVGLGSQTSGGIPTSVWNGDIYLEVTVGGETLEPRELIRSVPIAGMALTVPDGTITSDMIAPGAVGGWTFFENYINVVQLADISNTGSPPWENVSVSSHVPEGAAAVLVSIQTQANAPGTIVGVRPVGSSVASGQFWTSVWQNGQSVSASGIVRLDSSRSFQWRARTDGDTITAGTIKLWGYYMPSP